jgi:3-amino-4-hydroxybenzoic acid synthase
MSATPAARMCWADLRGAGDLVGPLRAEALHQRVDAVVVSHAAELAQLPPTVTGVLFAEGGALPAELGRADIVVVDPARAGDLSELAARHPAVEFARYVEIVDSSTLDEACASARQERWSVLEFRDPTKIPLEIVLAAAAGAKGAVVTVAADPEEAEVLFGVLEHGSDAVMMAPAAVGDLTRLARAARPRTGALDLVELTVTALTRVGMGERACVDTCSHLGQDEGILVGSRAGGLVLCVSETHALPYMPTRPFRVNAGALMSYTLGSPDRTRYLSELRAGATVLAVDASGRTRQVTVGRTKIETRPLLSVDAVAPDGREVNLILQDDWHVRVLGPGGAVLNSTALVVGDRLLGYLPDAQRHVGYPIDEFCREQ